MIDIENLSVNLCGGSSSIEIYDMIILGSLDLCAENVYLYNIIQSDNTTNVNIETNEELLIEFGNSYSGRFDFVSQNIDISNDVSTTFVVSF